MIEIDYFLFSVVVFGVVALFAVWSFNRREIAIKRLEEDRKDARQDIAKEQMKQLKAMQYQHELDLQRLELQIQSGQGDMTELFKVVLPLILNKQTAVSESVSDSEEAADSKSAYSCAQEITDSKSAESDVSEAVSSSENEEQKELREYVKDAEPVTDFRRFVDSAAGDAFFHKYKGLLNK